MQKVEAMTMCLFSRMDIFLTAFMIRRIKNSSVHGVALFLKQADKYMPILNLILNQKIMLGGHKHFAAAVSGNSLKFDAGAGVNSWTRIDDGNTNLAGNWRITGRMRDGSIQPIEKSARKTLKILSSTRFQWMAINTETKEFFGTGGGTYTFTNGKYTENIEFFSRDSSRVGASLSFDGSVANNVWTHKGLSSRGEPIHEEWTER